MQLKQPLPINSKFDTSNTNPDYSMTAPLNGDGSNFPCKGYLNSPGKHITAQYTAGGQYSIALEGTATHEGGSCQLSLSYDNGATFKVIHSIVGGCPLQSGYNFTMPAGLPAGNNVVFSWTWFNKVGNREMYQNCALVNIQGSGTSQFVAALPAMQIANVGKGCATIEGTEVVFPNPGQSIQFGGSYSNG
ncbi:putative endoglucanase, partial [Protomyces lactucae-debilis]